MNFNNQLGIFDCNIYFSKVKHFFQVVKTQLMFYCMQTHTDSKGEFIFRPYAKLRNGKILYPKKGKMLKIYIKRK